MAYADLTPVLDSGDVRIVRGDAYLEGRMLIWTDVTWDIAVDSIVVVILQNVAALIGARLDAQRVGLELSHAQSVALPAGVYPFSIQEILPNDDPVTLLRACWVTYLYPEPRPASEY